MALGWGAFLAATLCRAFFTYPPGSMHITDDGPSYAWRLVEFQALLRAGYVFPQWASHFRSGLGSPYFSYYQPGFFYAASVFAAVLPPLPALGATLWAFAVLGYVGMSWLVRERFGLAAGVLAGTVLLQSPYTTRELYVRGDFSEFSGMMTLPALLYCLTGWLEHGRPAYWRALAVGSGLLITLHCVAGLLGYGVLAVTTLWYVASMRCWRRGLGAGAALLVGIGLAAFYLLPLAFEWDFVQGDRAAMALYHYDVHFVDALALLGLASAGPLIDVNLGPVIPALIVLATALLVLRARTLTAPQRRLVVACWILTVVCTYLLTAGSRWVWELLPILQRIQFPWRFMLVLTVMTSVLAGSWVAWPWVPLIVAVVAFARIVIPTHIIWTHPVPRSAGEIARSYYAPDAADEWLPRGAVRIEAAKAPRWPRCEPPCVVDRFERAPGWLSLQVQSTTASRLLLPHYYFPVGWRATLNGRPIAIGADPQGLMTIELPPSSGVIELEFLMTPMRRNGVVLSALTLMMVAVVAFVRPRWVPGATA